MIDKTHLRIGNLLRKKESDTIVPVEQYMLCEPELIKFQSIPLNEDWLIKLGFESWAYNEYKERQFRKHMIILTLIPANYFHFNGIRIKSVHHLQNIYHALIEQELTIKP